MIRDGFRYLNLVELIIINEEVIGSRSQVRDVDLLEAAALRPMTSAFGADAFPGVIEKAAALFHSLSRYHIFVDGNKRTATVAMVVFLRLNAYTVTWQPAEALAFILEAATGRHDIPAIARWLEANSAPLAQREEGGCAT
jgi:death on curing protein